MSHDLSRKASLSLPLTTTVGELISLIQDKWSFDEKYQLVLLDMAQKLQLNPKKTLSDSGITDNSTLQVLPKLIAASPL